MTDQRLSTMWWPTLTGLDMAPTCPTDSMALARCNPTMQPMEPTMEAMDTLLMRRRGISVVEGEVCNYVEENDQQCEL